MKFIIAILIFSMIILFHELGHFLLAKKNKIKVNEFCLGSKKEKRFIPLNYCRSAEHV